MGSWVFVIKPWTIPSFEVLLASGLPNSESSFNTIDDDGDDGDGDDDDDDDDDDGDDDYYYELEPLSIAWEGRF